MICPACKGKQDPTCQTCGGTGKARWLKATCFIDPAQKDWDGTIPEDIAKVMIENGMREQEEQDLRWLREMIALINGEDEDDGI